MDSFSARRPDRAGHAERGTESIMDADILNQIQQGVKPIADPNTRPARVYLFNRSPEQLRLLGARGGRAYGRNQRVRRALLAASPKATPPATPVPRQNTADSIALLDARFPWLRGAEKRIS
jgi:hypothetical protein